MKAGSLRLRLLAGTLAWIVLAVALAGWGLRTLFQEHITQQLQAQLLLQLNQLSAAVDWTPDKGVTVAPMAGDARLEQPLSGLYWQVDEGGARPRAAVARSRSLWDQALSLPPPPAQYPAAGYGVLHLQDAQGHALLAVARPLQLPEQAAPPLRVVVAGDRALLAEPLQRFTRLLLAALAMLALGLAVAVALQLQLALQPLKLLRQRLAAVRSGEAAQLTGDFPRELQPLVGEFNHVLSENADMVQRAHQAGNLAHAVHTPLAILANAARRTGPLAQLVLEQVELARRQVEWHLARARRRRRARHRPAHAGAGARALAAAHHGAPARRARRCLRAGAASPGPGLRGEAQDLYELLGNLLDNAKWAARASRSTCSRPASSCASRSTTTARAFPRPSASACSSAACRATSSAPAPGWGWTSCARWPRPTAAACRRWPRPWAACACGCACRRPRGCAKCRGVSGKRGFPAPERRMAPNPKWAGGARLALHRLAMIR
jgi:hypothetical protein